MTATSVTAAAQPTTSTGGDRRPRSRMPALSSELGKKLRRDRTGARAGGGCAGDQFALSQTATAGFNPGIGAQVAPLKWRAPALPTIQTSRGPLPQIDSSVS